MSRVEQITASPEGTQDLAKDFASGLRRGDVVALSGDLGSGKTTFVQGLAEGLDYGVIIIMGRTPGRCTKNVP